MEDPRPLLFPHTWVPEPDLKRALAVFGSFALCVPWFAEPPGFMDSYRPALRVGILRPPEVFKPGETFSGTLKEYRLWMEEHKASQKASSLKAALAAGEPLEASWDIRARLKGAGPRESSREQRAFQWHLVLHLARETEIERRGAEEMLAALRTGHSPLREALEEPDTAAGFLSDLPPPSPAVADARLQPILEAFCGLFGAAVAEAPTLVTVVPALMGSIRDAARETAAETLAVPALPETEILLPDVAALPAGELTRWRTAFEERGGCRMLAGILEALRSGNPARPEPMAELARDLAREVSLSAQAGDMRLHLVHLPGAETPEPLFPAPIHHKTLACLEAFRGSI